MENIEDEIYLKMKGFVCPDLRINDFPWCKMAKGIEEIINRSVWHPVHQNIEETLFENLSFFNIFTEKTKYIWQKKMQKERSKKW